MAMMTMVPVRVINYPGRFSIKAALPQRHPSDALEVLAPSVHGSNHLLLSCVLAGY
jgi:hypothetical protein